MKRDFELIRMILREIEDLSPDSIVGRFTFDGMDNDTVAAHVVLLFEAGLIKGVILPQISGQPKIKITGLTWAGHDFVALSQNETIWSRARKTVLAPAAGATWDIVLEWLKVESLKSFGLS